MAQMRIERTLSGKNTRLCGQIGLQAPDPALFGAAQQHAVAPGEHIAVLEQRVVGDFRLRQQHRELALDRNKIRIAKNRLAAEAGAVEYRRLLEGKNVLRA